MGILPKLDKPLESLTQLEKEKALKKLRGETEELIDEMGQTSDKKAAPTVKKYVDEQKKMEELQQDVDVEQLKQKSNNKKYYQRYLIAVLQRFIRDEKISSKYTLYIDSDDEGLVLGIDGTDLYTAFKVCGIPKYDINACKMVAVKLGNTIAKLEGYVRTTSSGLILPDTLDRRKYGRTSK